MVALKHVPHHISRFHALFPFPRFKNWGKASFSFYTNISCMGRCLVFLYCKRVINFFVLSLAWDWWIPQRVDASAVPLHGRSHSTASTAATTPLTSPAAGGPWRWQDWAHKDLLCHWDIWHPAWSRASALPWPAHGETLPHTLSHACMYMFMYMLVHVHIHVICTHVHVHVHIFPAFQCYILRA